MTIEACILSLVVGLVRRGSLRSLARIPLRHYYLFIIPLLGFGLVYSLAQGQPKGTAFVLIRITNVLQYGLLVLAAILNFHIKEMRLFGLGEVMNFLAVLTNGGAMPISASALKIAGLEMLLKPEAQERFVRHIIMDSGARLKIFTDVIPVPGVAIPLFAGGHGSFTLGAEVVSLGDVLISIAVFILIQRYMCMRRNAETR